MVDKNFLKQLPRQIPWENPKEYFANIPNVGGIGMGRSSSLVGSGNNPRDMIDYYYNQDTSGYNRQRKGVQQY